jgi:uncharacterized repeat protein (TIGR03803 family)
MKTAVLTLLLVFIGGAQNAAGQKPVYKLLYSPPVTQTGGYPSVIFEVEPGVFYVLNTRTTNTFGASIGALTSEGAYKILFTFPPQPVVQSHALVQSTNGKLYGPGFIDGNQINFYFSLDPSGANYRQYPFPGMWGSGLQTTVVPSGAMYDIVGRPLNKNFTAEAYGLARIAEDGTITILHQFSASEGYPTGNNIVYGPDGNIYGIGNQQQNSGPGFIYSFTPRGVYSQLLSFPSFPSWFATPLAVASDGNLYGSFYSGGANNTGYIYQATLAGQLQTVANFPAPGTGMIEPESLMQAADGNLYGTTNSNDIFRYNPNTMELTSVFHLAANGSQGHCFCQLIEGMDGKIYGVTPSGGITGGDGVVFSLDIGLPKPLPVVSQIVPSSGAVGKQVMLWGNWLLKPSSVTFNGVLATVFGSTSVRSVWATVPAGATTGPITVSTANGSFITTGNFTVQ